jgi:hypothetical protein
LRGTWEEFCGLLGKSVDQVDRDIENLRAFGEEALENMSRMGIGYREMRQFRKLPEDNRLALIEAAKAGDKEILLDLAEEIISRHSKEKEELEKRATEAEQNYEAQQQVIEKKNQLIDDQDKNIHRLKRKIETRDPDEFREELHMEASANAIGIEGQINAKLKPTLQALAENGDVNREFMSGLISAIEYRLQLLREEFDIPKHDFLDWTHPDAMKIVPEFNGPASDDETQH